LQEGAFAFLLAPGKKERGKESPRFEDAGGEEKGKGGGLT